MESTRHANFDYDTATWVVWAKSQIATVFFSFSCYLCQGHRSHCSSDLDQ